MSLFLVQHGDNLPKETDPKKGLSDEGRETVERIAALAVNYGLMVSAIRHSGKKRAMQTAEIFAGPLHVTDISGMDGLGPLDDVTRFDPGAGDNLMAVGHLPFMEKLVCHLVTGDAGRPAVLKFQKGGIVCLDIDPENHAWFIKWTLFPDIK